MESVKPILFFGEEKFIPLTSDIVPDLQNGSYSVSNYGRIMNIKRGTILKQYVSHGYYYVSLYIEKIDNSKMFPVHRLVLGAFSNTPININLEPNHIDQDKSNNYLYNLEWMTHADNLMYTRLNRLQNPKYNGIKTGELSYNHNITLEDAKYIGELLEQGIKPIQIVGIINKPAVTFNVITQIKAGASWYYESGARELTFLIPMVVKYFGHDNLRKIHELLDNYPDIDDFSILNSVLSTNYYEGIHITTLIKKQKNLLDKIRFERNRGIKIL